jgi:hypothetical protein
MEHGDCYRGCFVDEKIVVVRCAQKTAAVGLYVKRCFCELVYLRTLRASDC